MIIAVLCAPALRAEMLTYRPLPERPGISISLPYSFGTHDDQVARISGELRLDPDAPEAASGKLSVPIEAIVSGNNERDCHMREALGLDYARSRYPRDHVCANDALPAGAIAFPEIVLEVRSVKAPPVSELAVGKETPISLDASWTIHGVTRPARLQLTASRDAKTPGAVRIRGSLPIRLADFGVVVKSAQVLFVTSSVAEVATVQFDLKLAPAR